MIPENRTPQPARADVAMSHGSDGSYLDWAAIFAGAVFALALSFLLMNFGAALGLSLTSPYRGEGVSAQWLAIAAAIWFVWVIVTGFGAGGYLAGRMRRRAGDAIADEVEVRDGAHGLMVWATGALIGMILAAAGVSGAWGVASSAVGGAVGTAADITAETASSEYFADLLVRNADPAAAPAAGPAAGASDGAAIGPDVRAELTGIVTRFITSGTLSDRDETYLVQRVASLGDLDQATARARVDEVIAEIEALQAAALETVEDARVAGVIFGFIAAATLLVGAVAAFFAAIAGGHHRDDGIGMTLFTPRN